VDFHPAEKGVGVLAVESHGVWASARVEPEEEWANCLAIRANSDDREVL
jgi:hypothetical protein